MKFRAKKQRKENCTPQNGGRNFDWLSAVFIKYNQKKKARFRNYIYNYFGKMCYLILGLNILCCNGNQIQSFWFKTC